MSEQKLSKGLDFYKPTMSQLEFEKHPDAEVTFRLKNRGSARLTEYVSPSALSERLADLQRGWGVDEIAYLASLTAQDGNKRFDETYLDFIADTPLPPVEVDYDDTGDLSVQSTGAWPLVTFWETVVMSELNELYFENLLKAEGRSISEVYKEGDRRLGEKIAVLKERPDIQFSDFGTRRRFSYDWHKHVMERLATECPENFVGTSNIYMAHHLGLQPIGTFAHELPMVYAALADGAGDNPLSAHSEVLRDWQNLYGSDLSTALTDTFTTDFFFTDFTPEQAKQWRALRHDSGDPIAFGEQVIDFYKQYGIDPTSKTIVFSDGLDIDTIVRLADHFKERIGTMFGWGTTLSNDLGLQALNIVMKAVAANGTPTVKLSDTEGKHTGPEQYVGRYQREVRKARILGAHAWQQQQSNLYVSV